MYQIIGSTGFLGSHLLKNLGNASALNIDLTQPITHFFKAGEHVLICAAITDVEKCYRDRTLSNLVEERSIVSKINGSIQFSLKTSPKFLNPSLTAYSIWVLNAYSRELSWENF
jgi:hypothetical protein